MARKWLIATTGGAVVAAIGSAAYISADVACTHAQPCPTKSSADAVSADGSVVLGTVRYRPFRWTRATGVTGSTS
ncbi:hypothetical protein Q3C01_38180 [Bradyrhizobium sp. UFLA05-109]